MDRLRQALEFTDREDDGWVLWSYQPGHQAAIYDAAKSVLDAPRIWWCDYWGEGNEWPFCITQDASRHEKCRWVRLVDDPQEGGEDG